MDEDITIINESTRYEKIKNFFINNKNKLITIYVILILLLCGYFFYKDLEKKNKVKLSNKYNTATADFIAGNKSKVEKDLIEIVNKKDTAYSPLALYFLVDKPVAMIPDFLE